MSLGFRKQFPVSSSLADKYIGRTVRCLRGFRQGREGTAKRVEHWEGGGGIHILVAFPNGAEHWHHIDTIELVCVNPV